MQKRSLFEISMSTICKLETGPDPRQPLVVKAQNFESGFKIVRNFRITNQMDPRHPRVLAPMVNPSRGVTKKLTFIVN